MQKITQAFADTLSDADLMAIPQDQLLTGPKAVLARAMALQGKEIQTLSANQKKTKKNAGPAVVALGEWQPTDKNDKPKGAPRKVLEFTGGDARPFNLGPAKVQRIIEAHERGEIAPLLDRLNSGES